MTKQCLYSVTGTEAIYIVLVCVFDTLCSKRAMVYACSGCESYYLQPMGKRLEEGSS